VVGYYLVLLILFLIFFGGFIVHVAVVAWNKRKGRVFSA